jgi:uncharacterized protein with WD repeat
MTAVAFRSDSGLAIKADNILDLKLQSPKSFKYSENGKYLGVIDTCQVLLYLGSSFKHGITTKTPPLEISFSPLGSWILIYEKYLKTDGTTDPVANVTMWDTDTGEMVWSWVQKLPNSWDGQWSQNENVFARMINGAVSVWDLKGQSNFWKITPQILKVEHLGSFSLSPGYFL